MLCVGIAASSDTEVCSVSKHTEGSLRFSSVDSGDRRQAKKALVKKALEMEMSRKPRADAMRNRERVLEAARTVFSAGGPEVSILTWRYAPRYAPGSTYQYPVNLFPVSRRNNAFYVLIRYASMVVLIIGIVSAIRALIQLRTNREIPRGILAIAFAVGWSIAHSIPAALLVFPEHRYTCANMLMMLSGGAAWFAYLGTNRVTPR
jgi:hypothetical protein